MTTRRQCGRMIYISRDWRTRSTSHCRHFRLEALSAFLAMAHNSCFLPSCTTIMYHRYFVCMTAQHRKIVWAVPTVWCSFLSRDKTSWLFSRKHAAAHVLCDPYIRPPRLRKRYHQLCCCATGGGGAQHPKQYNSGWAFLKRMLCKREVWGSVLASTQTTRSKSSSSTNTATSTAVAFRRHPSWAYLSGFI